MTATAWYRVHPLLAAAVAALTAIAGVALPAALYRYAKAAITAELGGDR